MEIRITAVRGLVMAALWTSFAFTAAAAEPIAESQAAAVKQYPALGVKDSPLNARFRDLYQLRQKEQPGYFAAPDWPLRLAREAAGPAGVVLAGGRAQPEAVVLRVEPDALIVRTGRGVGRVEYVELAEEERVRFNYDLKKAEAYKADVAKAEARAELGKIIEGLRAAGYATRIRVMQVAEEGVIAEVSGEGTAFVRCNVRGVADGDLLEVTLWPAGMYRYTTVMGAARTVRRFTTSVEDCLRIAAAER